jgi:diguanylate cyclase (GGDEF)-like protein
VQPTNGWAKYASALASLAVVLALVVVGTLDYVTGVALSFSLFYLLPVLIAGRWLGYVAGIVVAIVSALLWFFVEAASLQEPVTPLVVVWNGLVRLSFFLLFHHMLWKILSALARERELANTDGLTGALNSRQFQQLLDNELSRYERYAQPVTLAYLDVDNFKIANDRGGHALGDALLKAIVNTCHSTLRQVDVVARMGGDEFAILLPHTDHRSAQWVLTNLQSAINRQLASAAFPATVSIGAITCAEKGISGARLLTQADALMYQVKQSGKNGLLCQDGLAAAASAVEA